MMDLAGWSEVKNSIKVRLITMGPGVKMIMKVPLEFSSVCSKLLSQRPVCGLLQQVDNTYTVNGVFGRVFSTSA